MKQARFGFVIPCSIALGCGASQAPAPAPNPTAPAASAAPTPERAAPPVASAQTSSADASAAAPSTPAPSATPVEAAPSEPTSASGVSSRCIVAAATQRELDAFFAREECRLDATSGEATLPAAILVVVTPASKRVKSGESSSAVVTFENTSTRAVSVVFSWSETGVRAVLGSGPLAAANSMATTLGFDVTIHDYKNRATDMPPGDYGILGMLGTTRVTRVRLELGPRARVEGRVAFSATGFDQDKKYKLNSDRYGALEFPPPPPLKPGRYTLKIDVPALLAQKKSTTVSTTIDVIRK